jgi:hypothetical protein
MNVNLIKVKISIPGLNGSIRTSALEHNLLIIAKPSGDFKLIAIERLPLLW